MQGIYTYIPETNYVPREYSVAAILLFLFMVHTSLAPAQSQLKNQHKYIYKQIHRCDTITKTKQIQTKLSVGTDTAPY
jgi:uncharacterized protein YcnI